MSYFSGAASGLRPYHFTYPEIKLMMEEMLYKFIDEGKREHEEMRAFIYKIQTPPIPFPRRLRKEKEEAQQKKFFKNLMPKYAKFLKGLLTNKARLEEACTMTMNERCSTILLNKLPSKEKDIGSFTIPYDIGQLHINNDLADLGASISLMPYTMYEKLVLGEPKATRMRLELADRSIQYPRGIIETVLIKVDKFVLPIDFVILDMPEDSRVPIILGRPFLATARAMIDIFNKKITLRVGDNEVIFDVDQSIKRPTTEDDECYGIDDLDDTINVEAQKLLANEEPDLFLSRGLEKSIDQSDQEGCEPVKYKPDKDFDSDELIRRIASINTPYPFVQETAKPMKVEREHLYLASANEIDEKKPVSYSVNPIHVVPKKGGMNVVLNDNNKLIPSRTVTGWRVCIDYRKLNDATRKDHFPLPFIDQMMPFGLCNAPATFKRCMTAIFHDMVEDFMEVFMDDFSVFGAENLAADHFSRLENPDLGTFTEEEIADEFPDEHLMVLKIELNNDEPWYADYAFKLCQDNIMRRCVSGTEIFEILAHFHSGPTSGHHSASVIGRKVYESGFFWPSIYKDAKDYVMRCDACQRSRNISSRSEMP
ncbi:DNA-directed DNA polymerase [Tanacetum coccineum]